MVSDKSLYWIAIGVLIWGVGNSVVSSQNDWINCLNDRSLGLVQTFTDRAVSMMAPGGLLFDRTNDGIVRSQLAVARVQSKLVSVQARVAMRQSRFARLEAQKSRLVALSNLRRTMKCPEEKMQEGILIDSPDEPADLK